ncbi:hypothetical protein B0H11DRAFT_2322293 [Mycena galericulata]|nr:hypothetical protein B0H11DRAFT_2322293 [Mycena galericulata]
MSLSLSEAQLLGNWFETLTYGMYLVTCGFCARTLLCIGPEDRWRRPSEVRWLILSVGIALFVVATFDVIIGFLHILQAFAFYTGGGGAAQELSDISGWINVAKTAAHVAQMILGDFVLANIQVGCLSPLRRIPIDVALIRCYIVYSRHWKVLIPSLILYFGGVAIGIKLVEAQASLNHAETTVISSDIRPWSETFFCITAISSEYVDDWYGIFLYPRRLATDYLLKGLLIWRIWRVEREIEEFRTSASGTRNNHSPLRKVIRVIAESGFAYTLMVFLTFLVDLCSTNLVYCFADATHQATAIAFNVVIMRTSPSRDEQFTIFAANGRSAAENGRLTRLRFRAHITELTADIDDGDFAVKSIRASFVGPHEDLQMNTNTYTTHDKTEPEGC